MTTIKGRTTLDIYKKFPVQLSVDDLISIIEWFNMAKRGEKLEIQPDAQHLYERISKIYLEDGE